MSESIKRSMSDAESEKEVCVAGLSARRWLILRLWRILSSGCNAVAWYKFADMSWIHPLDWRGCRTACWLLGLFLNSEDSMFFRMLVFKKLVFSL
jgi:hypothetical protein